METRFADQVALVTGGARGIGEGIARRLAREGAHVVLVDRLEEELTRTVESFRKLGYSAGAACLDITVENEVESTIRQVIEHRGRIDILINSAGIVGPTGTSTADYPSHAFREILEINLYGTFLVTKYCLLPMLDRNYGRILLIASIGGKEGNPGMVGYVASKAGVMGLVKAAGKEYADKGITINGLAPAVIATPMNLDTDPGVLQYMTEKIPMKRLGTVEEVAALACWIVSKEASFNTGFVFDLSGGRATF